VIAFSVATSIVAVAALATKHPANRLTAHPSAANRLLHRAFYPINPADHIR